MKKCIIMNRNDNIAKLFIGDYMFFKREKYLERIKLKMWNGLIKIITGLRRCGKSYFLSEIFVPYLKKNGVKSSNIIKFDLDDAKNIKLRSVDTMYEYILKHTNRKEKYYIIIDEIQLIDNFWELLNSLLHYKNFDVYVTGSNSKFLTKDILTNYRGRGDELRLHPISYKEYVEASKKDKFEAYNEYKIYGGMPLSLLKSDESEKCKYLNNLYIETYYKDIIERYKIKNVSLLEDIMNVFSSSVGSYSSLRTILDTIISKKREGVSINTINKYIGYLQDSYLISSSKRYDIKGRKYINSPLKYYFEDIGLRNARLNFMQEDEGHIMENIIYNELIIRDYNVDIGIVEINERNKQQKYTRKQLEVDFVVNKGHEKFYIQSALNMDTKEKQEQEFKSFKNISDGFKKIIIRRDNNMTFVNEDGILNIGLFDFLMNEDSIYYV